METPAFQAPEVIVIETKGEALIQVRGYEWPNGPHVRVRFGWRGQENLPENAIAQRGNVLEIMTGLGQWRELGFHAHYTIGNDGVFEIGSTLKRRQELRAALIERGRHQVWGMIDDAFGCGF